MIARLLLLLSAYSPLVVLIGVRDHNAAQSWVIIAIGAVLTLGLPCVIALARKLTQPLTAVVVSTQDAAQEVTGYLTSFILPFATMSALTGRDFIALGLFGVLLAVAYLQSQRLALNPWLYFARRRILELDIGNGAELLIARQVPTKGDELTLTRLARGLYYLPRPRTTS
jgi:hypothetical protein